VKRKLTAATALPDPLAASEFLALLPTTMIPPEVQQLLLGTAYTVITVTAARTTTLPYCYCVNNLDHTQLDLDPGNVNADLI
jgi:hypothetical protein